jgi:hypothetical protein
MSSRNATKKKVLKFCAVIDNQKYAIIIKVQSSLQNAELHKFDHSESAAIFWFGDEHETTGTRILNMATKYTEHSLHVITATCGTAVKI